MQSKPAGASGTGERPAPRFPITVIDGRKAVPVRALPFMTGLSADDLAGLFAGTHPLHRWSLRSYHLVSEKLTASVSAQSWEAVEMDLADLASKLKMDGRPNKEWRSASIRELPAGVFVWLNELRTKYPRLARTMRVTQVTVPGPPEPADEQVEADLQRMIHRGQSNAVDGTLDEFGYLVDAPKVDAPASIRRLNFAPLLTVEEREAVLEGFQPLAPDAPVAPGNASALPSEPAASVPPMPAAVDAAAPTTPAAVGQDEPARGPAALQSPEVAEPMLPAAVPEPAILARRWPSVFRFAELANWRASRHTQETLTCLGMRGTIPRTSPQSWVSSWQR
jgi:hypothetical protein